MNCPRCEQASLDERDRDGVTIDVCTRCRGIWFDRGELEKLIARTTADFDDYDRKARDRDSEPPRPQSQYHDSDPPRQHAYRDHDDYRRKHPRKKSWVESLGDIFG